MYNSIIVRFGEVFLKKGNRPRFLKILRRNLRKSVQRLAEVEGVEVSSFHGRFEVSGPEGGEFADGDLAQLLGAVCSTFGIVSASPAVRSVLDYDIMEQTAVALAERVLERTEVRHFKVDASRSYKRFPMTSPELNRSLGAAVVKRFGLKGKMDSPDLTIGVEIHEHGAYLYAERTRGPGGLPVGSGGKAVLLLSGGIDSPVAGWMMAKRGCVIRPIHFHSFPYTSKRSLEKVNELAENLSRWLGGVRLTHVKLTPVQEYLRDNVPGSLLVLFYRRSMVRLAARLAEEVGALALVSGESLGQVASQTMENIAVIEDSSPLPVLRPLVGLDKVETVNRAKEIGTYETSIQPYDDCCSLFLPPRPETRGDVDRIRSLEARLEELAALEEEAWNTREEVRFGR